MKELLEKYPEAKMLGLSATNIRYLDGQRDMAREIFQGNIASEMTLGEAVAQGILPAPKYIIGLYSYRDDLKELEKRTMEKRAGDREAERLLGLLKRTLEQADDLDRIFQRHMRKRDGKYIVFCADKAHMDEMKSHVREWFRLVDENMGKGLKDR